MRLFLLFTYMVFLVVTLCSCSKYLDEEEIIEDIDYSCVIVNVKNYLEYNYKDYSWSKKLDNDTGKVCNVLPININGVDFPVADINEALMKGNIVSQYGGCGPLAIIGAIDYYIRLNSFNDLYIDLNSSDTRVSLALNVFKSTKTYEIGTNEKRTLMLPSDYSRGFNELSKVYGLSSTVESAFFSLVLPGLCSVYMDKIINQINEGRIVTLMTALSGGNGQFANHYSNIYGYECWIGTHKTTNRTISKWFLKARLNLENDNLCYCDINLFRKAMVTIITYNKL